MRKLHDLYHAVFAGMDPAAPLEAYQALVLLTTRAVRAEEKWHQYHVPPIYGPTCPACNPREVDSYGV